jgi:stage II sporulation protein P
MRKKQNPLLKIISCVIMVCAMLFSGNLREKIAPSSLDVRQVVSGVIGTVSTKKSKELTSLAKESNEVFNSYEKEEDEKDPEPTPPTEIKETQLIYSNNGEYINYDGVLIKNHTTKTVDLLEMMKEYTPPRKNDDFKILIVHTHGSEAYSEHKTSRSEDISQNVIHVGQALADRLTEKGFNVLHDPKMHDIPSYNGSYKNCLKTVEWYLEHYDGIGMVLDVHRDAIEQDGKKLSMVYDSGSAKAAQLMLVSGTNEGGLSHPEWEKNLCFAVGLQQKINELYPGLMRPIDLRVERFNQHTTPCSLIVEFGGNGNSLDEAITSAGLLADAISEYIKGD